MSESENSDFEMNSGDVDELIVSALSSGPKAPDKLKNLVMEKAKVSERTYYRRLEILLKTNVIEEVVERNSGSRLNWKYALKTSESSRGAIAFSAPLKNLVPVEENVLPSRRYLETAAWLKQEPDDWSSLKL